MKAFINQITALAIILIFLGCEERFESDYTEYNPPVLKDNDGAVSYTNFDAYPVNGIISSDAPTVSFDNTVKFKIDTIKAPLASTYNSNKLTIDSSTGVISYDNTGVDLSLGAYVISVEVNTPSGIAVYEDVVTMTVNEVPISVGIDNTTANVGSLEVGTVVGTVSYTDTSGEGLINSVTYSIVGGSDVFEINSSTGAITKIASAESGPQTLSIQVDTNLGTVVAINLITITVGPAPTIEYVQLDGSTELTKVTISPNTAYTSFAPTLNDMTAVSWAIDLPASLDPYSSSFSMGSAGEITVAGNGNLPEGNHVIGVTPTNSGGITFSFENVLTLTIESRQTVYFDDQFDDDSAGDLDLIDLITYPQYSSWKRYTFSGAPKPGAANSKNWQKAVDIGSNLLNALRIQDPGTFNSCIVKELDISGVPTINGKRELTLSFGEALGYGATFVNAFNREFSYGESNANLEQATPLHVDSEWTKLIPTDGTWLGPNWNSGSPTAQPYTGHTLNLTNFSGNTVYIMFRIEPSATPNPNQGGQWIIDYLTGGIEDVFTAEEE